MAQPKLTLKGVKVLSIHFSLWSLHVLGGGTAPPGDLVELTQAGLGQAETTCLTISKTGGLRPTLGAEAGRGGDAGAALGGLCPRARARRDGKYLPCI